MPIYEYQCEKKGHHFELLQSMSAPRVTQCIHCESEARRVISKPAVHGLGDGGSFDFPSGGGGWLRDQPFAGLRTLIENRIGLGEEYRKILRDPFFPG